MGLLGNFLSWLATHLVAIAFAIFLVVGVYLRDSFFAPESAASGSASTSVSHHPSLPEQGSSIKEKHLHSEGKQIEGPDGGESTEVGPVSESGPAGADIPLQTSPDAGEFKEVPPTFRPMQEDVATLPSASGETVSTRFRDPALQPKARKTDLPKLFAKRLDAARRAFSREDLDSAELHYLRYLSDRPEDAVAFAELGNLYRAMGRTPDALDAYFEAGLRFRDRGEWSEVKQLAIILDTAGDARGGRLLGQVR